MQAPYGMQIHMALYQATISGKKKKQTFYLQNSKKRKDEKKKFNACLESEILSATVSGGALYITLGFSRKF